MFDTSIPPASTTTMRIQLTTSRAGPLDNDSNGDVIDVPEHEARRLIETGQATLVAEPVIEAAMLTLPAPSATLVETTMADPAEAAERRGPPRTQKARNKNHAK